MTQISKHLLELAREYIDQNIDSYAETLNRIHSGKLKVLQTDHPTPEDAKKATLRRFETSLALYQQAKTDLDAGNHNTDILQMIFDFLLPKTRLQVVHNVETRELEKAMTAVFQDERTKTICNEKTGETKDITLSRIVETRNGLLRISGQVTHDEDGETISYMEVIAPSDETWIDCKKFLWIWRNFWHNTGAYLMVMPLGDLAKQLGISKASAWRLMARIGYAFVSSQYNFYPDAKYKGRARVSQDIINRNLVSRCDVINGMVIFEPTLMLMNMYERGKLKLIHPAVPHIPSHNFIFAVDIYDKLADQQQTLKNQKISVSSLLAHLPKYPKPDAIKSKGSRHWTDRFIMPLVNNLNKLVSVGAITYKFTGLDDGQIPAPGDFMSSYIEFEVL